MDGIAWLARHKLVGGLALTGALASIGYMLAFSILVLIARDRLGLGETAYGFLLAFSALGGLLATFAAPALRRRLGAKRTIAASLLLGALSLSGLTFTTDPLIAGALLAVYIFHAVVWNICSTSLRQRLVPDSLLGKVGGATRVMGLSGLAIGSLAGGLLGTISLMIPVATASGVFVICTVLAAVLIDDESFCED